MVDELQNKIIYTVFVNKIPPGTREHELTGLCEHCGNIIGCFLKRDSSKPFTYGFVRFSEKESALRAIDDLDGISFKGNTLNFEMSRRPLSKKDIIRYAELKVGGSMPTYNPKEDTANIKQLKEVYRKWSTSQPPGILTTGELLSEVQKESTSLMPAHRVPATDCIMDLDLAKLEDLYIGCLYEGGNFMVQFDQNKKHSIGRNMEEDETILESAHSRGTKNKFPGNIYKPKNETKNGGVYTREMFYEKLAKEVSGCNIESDENNLTQSISQQNRSIQETNQTVLSGGHTTVEVPRKAQSLGRGQALLQALARKPGHSHNSNR